MTPLTCSPVHSNGAKSFEWYLGAFISVAAGLLAVYLLVVRSSALKEIKAKVATIVDLEAELVNVKTWLIEERAMGSDSSREVRRMKEAFWEER